MRSVRTHVPRRQVLLLRDAGMSERQVQYEFKVIVRVREDTWPHEVGGLIRDTIDSTLDFGEDVVSVEQVRDGW